MSAMGREALGNSNSADAVMKKRTHSYESQFHAVSSVRLSTFLSHFTFMATVETSITTFHLQMETFDF